MISFIYLLIFLAWIVLFIGFYIKDFTICALSGIFFMVLGVYVAANGLDGFSNLATQTLASIHIVLGFYVLARGSYELYKDM